MVSACGPPVGWFRQRPWGQADLLRGLYYVPPGRKHPLNRVVGTENNTQQNPVKILGLVTDLKSRLESKRKHWSGILWLFLLPSAAALFHNVLSSYLSQNGNCGSGPGKTFTNETVF